MPQLIRNMLQRGNAENIIQFLKGDVVQASFFLAERRPGSFGNEEKYEEQGQDVKAGENSKEAGLPGFVVVVAVCEGLSELWDEKGEET
jgi:hypothetical protein